MKVCLQPFGTEKYYFQNAEKINEDRWNSIENYMLIDAGVKPIGNSFVAYVINEKEWEFNPGGFVVWKGKVIEENSKEFITNAILIERDGYTGTSGDNETFVHEGLGHIGFNKYISLRKDDNARKVSEAFSRTLDSFVCENRDAIINDSKSKTYPDGTAELTKRAFEIYSKAGKKAIVLLFYSTQPELLNNESLTENTLVDRIYKDKELVKAIAVLSVRYGGRSIGDLLRYDKRENLIREVRDVYDETVSKSSYISEKDLMFQHLKEEFSLGDSLTKLYLKDVKPSCLDELIEKKNVPLIDRASELKWIYAHAGTNSPNYGRGLSLLNHFMGTVKKITDLNGIAQAPQFQDEVMVAYNKRYGNGEKLEKNFKKFGVTYRDINGLFNKEKVPYVVAKRGISYALTLAFRKILKKKSSHNK